MNGANRSEELAQGLLNCPYAELSPLQKSVIDLIAAETPSGADPILSRDDRTFGQRLADRVASIGGSWGFIIGFGLALILWIGWNQVAKGGHLAFDPYPFIFAIQAPVIMMSQNRQSAQDRRAAEHDYVVNLRAELEIMHLHDKMDAMRNLDLARLVEAQNQTLNLLKVQIAELSAGRN